MAIIDFIKKNQMTARIAKDTVAKNVLTFALSEVSNVGKNDGNRQTTDAEAIACLKKIIKNLEETRKAAVDNNRNCDDTVREIQLLSDYLPVQMSREEIEAIFKNIHASAPDYKLSDAMKFMKDKHAGTYDGKLVSEVARSIFGK